MSPRAVHSSALLTKADTGWLTLGQVLLYIGSFGLLLSVFMTSLCKEYWQFILAQAILGGPSMSLITWPPVAVVSRHLPRHRGLAIGLVVGGSSIGGIIWPVMLNQLLTHDSVSFGWTMRIVGFTMLPLLLFACLTVREPVAHLHPPQPVQPPSDPEASSSNDEKPDRQVQASASNGKKIRRKADYSILRNKTYLLLCIGLSTSYLGLFNPLFYVSAYAVTRAVSTTMAFNLLAIVNGASLLGRVIPGFLADRYGHYNLIIMSALFSMVTAFCWTAVTDLAGLIVWSAAYGFSSGVSALN